MTKNKGKSLFDLFSFQYKPLERHWKKNLASIVGKDQAKTFIQQYNEASYVTKIKILDGYAQYMGL